MRGGYARLPVVEDPGTFAVRGGVIDVFVPLYRFPVRIELFGDQVESIRFFDPETQRTMRAVDEIYVHPVRETVRTRGHRLRDRILEAADLAEHPSSKTRAMLEQIDKGEDFFGIEALTPAFHERMASIFEYLPAGALVFVDEPDACIEALEASSTRARESYRTRLGEHRLAFPPEDFYLSTDELRALFDRGQRVEAHRSRSSSAGEGKRGVGPLRRRAAPRPGASSCSGRAPRSTRSCCGRWRRGCATGSTKGVRALIAVPSLQHAERLRVAAQGLPARARTLHRAPHGASTCSTRARSG